ncbi:hypothetical protein KCM76_14730 [Zooshikella marina]|uniref:ApeI family dehydratase n=1 Tax=Zooshikella ganghwensis TaxID=202772 RepID=UPI001BAF0F50|nr:hypothetical protein [Zooshikella ganghwensis]MBU2707248.1 hypothetical protein [Zooshikella ganghwensis]
MDTMTMNDQPLLPEIIEVSKNHNVELTTIDIKINIKPDNLFFEGHFPNMPILPGVAQVHWVMLFAKEYLSVTFNVHRIEAIKFQRIIQPNSQLTLQLIDNKCGKLSFSYRAGDVVYGSGRIIYDQ